MQLEKLLQEPQRWICTVFLFWGGSFSVSYRKTKLLLLLLIILISKEKTFAASCLLCCVLFHQTVLLSVRLCGDQAVSSKSNPWGKPVQQRRSTKRVPAACQPAAGMLLQTAPNAANISGINSAGLHAVTNQMLKHTFQLGLVLVGLKHSSSLSWFIISH